MNLLKQEKTCKQSIAGKRIKAGWDNKYLEKILFGQPEYPVACNEDEGYEPERLAASLPNEETSGLAPRFLHFRPNDFALDSEPAKHEF